MDEESDELLPAGVYFKDDLDGGRLVKKDTARLSHADWCRLSQMFNLSANLWTTQDQRINDWLKGKIEKAKRREDATRDAIRQSWEDLAGSGGIVIAP